MLRCSFVYCSFSGFVGPNRSFEKSRKLSVISQEPCSGAFIRRWYSEEGRLVATLP